MCADPTCQSRSVRSLLLLGAKKNEETKKKKKKKKMGEKKGNKLAPSPHLSLTPRYQMESNHLWLCKIIFGVI